MIPKNLLKSVQNAIENGKTQKALELLSRSKAIKANVKLSELYRMIAAQWSVYKKNEIQRIQSEDFQQRTLNQINLSILKLVDGDLSILDKLASGSNQNTNQASNSNTPLKYFIYGIAFLLAIYGGMKITGMISPDPVQPIVIHNPSKTTKPVLREFKVYILNDQGVTHSTQAVKIYRDLTGEISISGTKYKIDQVTYAENTQLDFSYLNNGRYHYKYMLPSLSEIKPGVNTNKGIVLYNNQRIADWMAEEIPLGE